MPPLPVMFKTVSTDCNLDCSYCYYRGSLAEARPRRRIDEAMLERFIPQYMAYVSDTKLASMVWQGGEPTLAGLAFFERMQRLQVASAAPGTHIANSLQTNGVQLDDEWGAFLKRNAWLVGVSLDGPEHVHDQLRRNRGGGPTFSAVMRGIEVLRRHKVDFNILCVLGPHNVERASELMRFYRAQGFTHVQFIPGMDFQAFQPERAPRFLIDARQYGEFLTKAFDHWYEGGGPTLSVRQFDNFLQSYAGIPNDLCVQAARCDAGIVVEWDGSVYPCDFYVAPSWKLGNVMDTPLREIADSPARRAFVAQKQPLPEECRRCEWLAVCKSGCPRNRTGSGPDQSADHFCASYKQFFAHADARLRDLGHALDNRARYLEAFGASATPGRGQGPNDRCPCGSGTKVKKCCGAPKRRDSYVFQVQGRR